MIRRISKNLLNKNKTKRTGRAQQANRAQTRGTTRTAEPLSRTRGRSNVRAPVKTSNPTPRPKKPSKALVLPPDYIKAKKRKS